MKHDKHNGTCNQQHKFDTVRIDKGNIKYPRNKNIFDITNNNSISFFMHSRNIDWSIRQGEHIKEIIKLVFDNVRGLFYDTGIDIDNNFISSCSSLLY